MTPHAMVHGGLEPLMRMPETLADLSRPASLMQAFRRRIPELAAGSMALKQVEPRRLRLREGPCTAVYDLTVDDGRGDRRIRLTGIADPWGTFDLEMPEPMTVLGAPDWRCGIPELHLALRVPPPDTALPSLSRLLDPGESLALLHDAMRRNAAYRDVRLSWCKPTVARYKPGSRCTVAYELGYEPGHAGPERVIAKTYSGDKGRIAFDGMLALWRSPLRSSRHVTIAEPLAFIEELNVLLQGPVPGIETLKDLVKSALAAGDSDALCQAFDRTAVGLSALHGCGAAAATPATWQQELADVRNRLTRLARWVPDVGTPAGTWLDTLDELARLRPADTPVPSHRSFRPAQVLLDGGDVGFIDFDGFCEAEPAMDLALFVATVKNLGMRAAAPAEKVERLCDGFLDEYRGSREVTPERVALWEALYHLTNALNCWAKVRPERVSGNLALLDRYIERTGLPSI